MPLRGAFHRRIAACSASFPGCPPSASSKTQPSFASGKSALPCQAYFVKCDRETTPQNDIDHGTVNIVVGFAPLKPAEFVVIKLQQIAGQIET